MAEAREGEAGRPGSHSYARDLLRRFSGSFRPEDLGVGESAATEEDSAEIELSLGLSLGGCFGVDAVQRRGLVRSSSVASLPFLLGEEEQEPTAIPVLARTCSLPVEAEEEQRKRKELQSLRRLEAKRKRSEKRNGGAARWGCRAPAEEGMQVDGEVGAGKEEKAEGERFWAAAAACPPTAPNAPAAVARAAAAARAAEGMRGFPPVTQGSVGSTGSSSSGVSDFDNRLLIRQGSGITGTDPSPSVFQPLPSHTDSKAAVSPMSPSLARQPSGTQMEVEDSLVKPEAAASSRGVNGLRSMMEEMPCVSTRGGGGPGGRKVEGFLYRYRKGEEVRIVCVCHGNFFTPAEFVKHAGGGDVAHPLRHIVVNPNPSSFL